MLIRMRLKRCKVPAGSPDKRPCGNVEDNVEADSQPCSLFANLAECPALRGITFPITRLAAAGAFFKETLRGQKYIRYGL